MEERHGLHPRQAVWSVLLQMEMEFFMYSLLHVLLQNYNKKTTTFFFSSSPVEEVPPSLPLRRPTACILSCGETDLQQRVDTLRLLASRVGSSISSFSSVVPSFCAS